MVALHKIVSVILLVLWPFTATAGIIFPPDKYHTQEDSLSVLMRVDEKDPKNILLKNDGGETKADVSKGFFRWEVTLKAGKNIIQYGTDARNVFLAQDEKPPGEYQSASLHEAMDDCENCHENKDLKSEMPGLCYECHEDATKSENGDRASVHSPVADGDCIACHNPHFGKLAKLLDKEGSELCAECHDDIGAGKDDKPIAYPHDPVSSGECLSCHAPHASDEAALALKPGAELCIECHDDFSKNGDGDEKKAIHDPVGSGECTSCHVVHGGEVAALLKTSQEDLCKECHDIPFMSDSGQPFKYPHEPVDGFECLSCHEAHASEFAGMIKREESELCLECHDDPRHDKDGREMAVIHDPVSEGCASCHKPHGSDAPSLLVAEGQKLCLECHDDVKKDADGFDFKVLHAPVEKDRCGDCHNIHASQYGKLLQGSGNRFCLQCHKDSHEDHRESIAVREGKRTEVPANFPLDKTNKNLACTGCHMPHGSAYEFLFVDDRRQMCVRCHRI